MKPSVYRRALEKPPHLMAMVASLRDDGAPIETTDCY
jgi:hypothetical protein